MQRPRRRETSEMQITTVGLDIVKNLFQVHGADAQRRMLLKRKLARGKVLEFFATLPACLVGLEACGAAHKCGSARGEKGNSGPGSNLLGLLALGK